MCQFMVKAYSQCPGSDPQNFCVCKPEPPCTYVSVEREVIEGTCGICYQCRKTRLTLAQWLSSNLTPLSDPGKEDMAPRRRSQPINSMYNIYHVVLGQRIWSLDSYLAKPITEIMCKHYSEKTILDLLCSEKHIIEAKLASARTHYEAYLQSNRLVAVELDVDMSQDQGRPTPKTAPEQLDDAVVDYWCTRGSSIQASDVAFVGVFKKESLAECAMVQGRTLRVKRCILPVNSGTRQLQRGIS